MKVYGLTAQYNPQFRKNNDWHTFGYDDEISESRRDYIRQHIEEYSQPYQSIYERECNKSEAEVKQMVSDLVRKPVIVDNNKLQQLNLYNLDTIGENSYRGAMIHSDNLEKVKKLYDAGIRTIIPVGRGFTDLQNACEKAGIEYQAVDFSEMEDACKTIDDIKRSSQSFARDEMGLGERGIEVWVNKKIRLWNKNSRAFIDKFTKYIQNMQKGNVYIGCDFGTYSTDTAIMFDYLFNPKMKHGNGLNMYNRVFADQAEDLYRNLTKSDKLKMGWTKDFEAVFFKRLEKLKR